MGRAEFKSAAIGAGEQEAASSRRIAWIAAPGSAPPFGGPLPKAAGPQAEDLEQDPALVGDTDVPVSGMGEGIGYMFGHLRPDFPVGE